MARRLKGPCPACGTPMEIAQYRCPNCQTEVSGVFQACQFCHLEPDIQKFITLFLIKRGNIKLVERELGVSYPTVRKELKRVILALGYSDDDEPPAVSRFEKAQILDRLDKGEIDFKTAMAMIEGEEREE